MSWNPNLKLYFFNEMHSLFKYLKCVNEKVITKSRYSINHFEKNKTKQKTVNALGKTER